jgi:hypothetical protein
MDNIRKVWFKKAYRRGKPTPERLVERRSRIFGYGMDPSGFLFDCTLEVFTSVQWTHLMAEQLVCWPLWGRTQPTNRHSHHDTIVE